MNLARVSAPGRAAARLLELGLLCITPLVFYRGFSEQFTTIKLVLTEGIVLAGGVGLTLGLMWGGVRWPEGFRQTAPLGLLAIGVLVSCLTSPLPAFSLVEAQYFLCGPLWLLVLVSGRRGEARVQWLGALVTAASAAMAGIALFQWAGYDPLQFGGYHVEWGTLRRAMRLYSTLGNPNFVAGYLIGAIFLALALAATAQRTAVRILSAAAVLAIFVAILGTRSRGAWLGLAAGLGIARLLWKPPASTGNSSAALGDQAKVIPPTAWLPPVGLILLFPDLAQQVRALLSHLEGRLFLSRASWPMFAEHPVLGNGWGMFQFRFPDLQAQFLSSHPEYVRYWTHTRQLHNDPLQILYEAGAVGFVAMGWVLWRYGRELREASSGSSRSSRVWLGASAGGVTAILVDSLLNFQFAVPPTLILLFTLLALPFLLKADDVVAAGAPEGNSRARLSLRIFGSGLVLGLAAFLALGIARRAAGDRALALGLEQERKGDITRAEQHFREGIERTPADGRLHYGLARALYVRGQHVEALTEVLRAEGTVADSHLEVLRARILDQMGYAMPALAAYRHALWLNPTLKSVPADIDRLRSGHL